MINMIESVVLAAVLAAGCVSAPVATVDPGPVPPSPAAAVVVGLTNVDPAAYGGWAGACPGSDVDAKGVAGLCRDAGIPATVLTNAEATVFRFLKACARAAAAVTPAAEARLRPLVLIYYSGHGGQVSDAGGDEADGKDETLCLWDRQLVDDVMADGLSLFPAGARVAFITDSCNSGSNYRAPADWAGVVAARRSRGRGSVKCQFIHIGGCGDGESSFGGAGGGVATAALLSIYKQVTGTMLLSYPPQHQTLTWRQWFDLAAQSMPRNQKLVWAEADGFGNMEAMR